ncbi:proliferating cell nuclear antigen (pcna) [Flavobacteriaceae bacterium]|nr:proliferating cell nuclear antigen (pcna) [Flavobacteriaceae bacterium]
MKFKTVQATAVKAAFEVLKDILNDVNIYFNKSGINILTLDTARAALVDLSLNAENFEEYVFKDVTELSAGFNITNTYKLLKSISNNDILTGEIETNEFFKMKIENKLKNSHSEFSLKLLDIDEDQIQKPDLKMDCVTTMPSINFQRICRDMNNLATDVQIIRKDNEFIIQCEGDFANQKTVIECTDETPFKGTIQGTYSLKYLNLFTKATGMCSTVQIMQEFDNRFLVLKYNIANLGELKFYLATKIDEDEI